MFLDVIVDVYVGSQIVSPLTSIEFFISTKKKHIIIYNLPLTDVTISMK